MNHLGFLRAEKGNSDIRKILSKSRKSCWTCANNPSSASPRWTQSRGGWSPGLSSSIHAPDSRGRFRRCFRQPDRQPGAFRAAPVANRGLHVVRGQRFALLDLRFVLRQKNHPSPTTGGVFGPPSFRCVENDGPVAILHFPTLCGVEPGHPLQPLGPRIEPKKDGNRGRQDKKRSESKLASRFHRFTRRAPGNEAARIDSPCEWSIVNRVKKR
jgi:hypothetical protein